MPDFCPSLKFLQSIAVRPPMEWTPLTDTTYKETKRTNGRTDERVPFSVLLLDGVWLYKHVSCRSKWNLDFTAGLTRRRRSVLCNDRPRLEYSTTRRDSLCPQSAGTKTCLHARMAQWPFPVCSISVIEGIDRQVGTDVRCLRNRSIAGQKFTRDQKWSNSRRW